MGVHVCQMTGQSEIEACFEMVTSGGARTLDLRERYGIEVGRPANLIVLAAKDRYEAILRRAVARYVISKGRILVETKPSKPKWHP